MFWFIYRDEPEQRCVEPLARGGRFANVSGKARVSSSSHGSGPSHAG